MKNLILKNSGMGVISQIVSMILVFVSRSFFIKYLGMEVLGLNSTLLSILSTLSLAELGFQTAIIYRLYRPVQENNQREINEIISILKVVYRGIAVLILLLGIALCPFLHFILKNIEITYQIYLYFLLIVLSSVSSYLLAYKRALLYADQKDYYCKLIDMLSNIGFNILQIITLFWLRSYFIYLVLKIIQVILSNIIINILCCRLYPFLKVVSVNRKIARLIFLDTKNVFASRVASYVYSSTDNLIISSMVGTISVGYLVNYTTVTSAVKQLTTSMLSPIIPIIGNLISAEKNKKSLVYSFDIYTHVRYCLSLIILVPLFITINDFISAWIGSAYLLDPIITVLLVLDLFISLVHTSCEDFLIADGAFKETRNIAIFGAGLNLILSLSLVSRLGIIGVLIGTVVSQSAFWIGRSYIVFFKCFECSVIQYLYYWRRMLYYILLFVGALLFNSYIAGFISLRSPIFSFICKGLISVVLSAIIFIFGCFPLQIHKACMKIFLRKFSARS